MTTTDRKGKTASKQPVKEEPTSTGAASTSKSPPENKNAAPEPSSKAHVQPATKAKSEQKADDSDMPQVALVGGDKQLHAPRKIKNKVYEQELARLQIELVKLQEWIKHKGLKVVVLFEGRDAAGKGGAIKRITEKLSPRVCRVVALPAPTEREKTQWYFQRYVPHLPAAGEMVLFDRSWYNRAGVERVMGFCTDEEYREFLRSCPEFERMLVRSGIQLIKYWFSVSNEEQERRFQARIYHPTKHWKLSPMDLQSRARWVAYSRAKDQMFSYTDIKQAPWYVVEGDVKKRARLNVINHLLTLVDYQDLSPKRVELPPRIEDEGYVRPPLTDQTFVPQTY